jgi:cell wall-associated NlpC family hydrolase
MPVKTLQNLRFIAFFALLSLLSACATTSPRGNSGGPGSESFGLGESVDGVPALTPQMANEIIIRALGLVGTPYRYGGASPTGGFDCSGLVMYVFNDVAGIKLPRTTRAQIDMPSAEVNRNDLLPGDLVFFNTLGGRVSHIGIYVGENRFVHAPSSGGTVRLDRLDNPYWNKYYVAARRIIQ